VSCASTAISGNRPSSRDLFMQVRARLVRSEHTPALWAEAGNPWVAAPPRELTPGDAHRAAVSVSWPSRHECMPRTGPRPRSGTQSQRTPARARVAAAIVAGGKVAPPRGRVVRLREETDPFPGCTGLVGLLGRKRHPGPLGSSGGPAHQLGPQSQFREAQWTSVHWASWAKPAGPLSAQWHIQPTNGPLSEEC
jgi:hypothetical protein